MTERTIKLYISVLLLMLMSIGLAISTLHSHHHLQWNHTEFADTGHCITSDEAFCPITGCLLQVEVPQTTKGITFFRVEEVVTEQLHRTPDRSVANHRGRSPPAAV